MLHYVTASQITNVGKYRVVSKTPAECSDEELKNFATVLAEGGQVAISGMMTRIKLAKSLGFAYNEDGELVGVSALKVPLEAYRRQVESGAGVSLPSSEYPYDVGWLYVKPEYRGAKAGQMLRYLLVQPVLGINAGAFATIRHDNFMPQRIITKYGFERAGHVWTSEKTGNAIDLFVRDADKGALQSVASAEIEYEAIYMSPVLASMLSDSHVEAMCLRVPSLACVAASALSLGYNQAGSDLAVAIATEDADLAAHALNLLHTDVEADIHKKDPDFKIIGDIEPAALHHEEHEEHEHHHHDHGDHFHHHHDHEHCHEHEEACSCPECTGAPEAEGPDATEKVGLLFQAAIAPDAETKAGPGHIMTVDEARNLGEQAIVKDLAALVSGIPAAREDLNNVELGVTPSYHTVCLEHLGRLGCPDIGAIENIVKAPDVSLDMNEAHEVFLRLDSDIRGKLSEAEGPEADRLQRVLINLETLMSDIFQSNVALASEYVPFGDVLHRTGMIRVVGIRPVANRTGVWEILTHFQDGTVLKSVASNKRSLGLCLNMLKPDTKVNFRGTLGRTVKDGILLQDGRALKLLDKSFANDKAAEVVPEAKEGSPVSSVASTEASATAAGPRIEWYDLMQQLNVKLEEEKSPYFLRLLKSPAGYTYGIKTSGVGQVSKEDATKLAEKLTDLVSKAHISFVVISIPDNEWALSPKAEDNAYTPRLVTPSQMKEADASVDLSPDSDPDEEFYVVTRAGEKSYMDDVLTKVNFVKLTEMIKSGADIIGVYSDKDTAEVAAHQTMRSNVGAQFREQRKHEEANASVAVASTATDRLYSKIEERLKSSKPALRSSSVTISELAGSVLVVIQDVVLKPDGLSKIVGRTVVDKTKTFDRSSGAEFELEKTPGKFGRVGDVSIKINTGNSKQIQDALGLIKRLFNNSLSYGGNTIAEATAATEDLRTQAIHEICTSLTRTIDRSRNMFSAISVLAKQESAGDGIVEIPETVKIAIAKCYEGFYNVEVFVFRQLDQDKAVLEPGYKDLSKEESKAVASLFIPLYRNRKVSAYRTALYTVADAFGTSKPRVPGDLIKLAQTLPPACDFLEAGVNRIVSSLDNVNTATASLEGTDSSLYTNFTGFELDRENNIPDRNKYVGLVENQIVVLLQDKFGNIETKLPFKLLNGKNELPAFHVKTTKDWEDLQERIHRAFDLGM